jgi:hypothetical protein
VGARSAGSSPTTGTARPACSYLARRQGSRVDPERNWSKVPAPIRRLRGSRARQRGLCGGVSPAADGCAACPGPGDPMTGNTRGRSERGQC